MTFHIILSSFFTLYLTCVQPLMRACSSHLPLLASIFAQVTSPLSPIDAAGVSDPRLYPLSPPSSNHQNSRVGLHPSLLSYLPLFLFAFRFGSPLLEFWKVHRAILQQLHRAMLLLSLRARISSVRYWVKEGGSVLSQPSLWIQRPHEGRDGAGGQVMALT